MTSAGWYVAAALGMPSGEEMRAMREATGLSMREAARHADLSHATVSLVERGRIPLSEKTCIALQEAYANELASGDD